MRGTTVGNRYALAIYEIAIQNNQPEEVYRELKVVMEIFETDKDFKNFIESPLIKKDDKKKFVENLFSKKFSEETVSLLQYLIDKSRLVNIKEIVTEYLKIYYEKNQIIEAEAIFASKPSDIQIQNLIAKLKLKENKEIKLNTKLDKSIIGGVIVKIGDKIIDASIKREIDTFRRNFKI